MNFVGANISSDIGKLQSLLFSRIYGVPALLNTDPDHVIVLLHHMVLIGIERAQHKNKKI